jgi:hypothetical protein
MTKEITKEQLIKILDTYLFGWEYKDIERASIQGQAKLAGFILGCCFIDTMAGFYAGIDKRQAKRNSGKRFKDFVKKYLPRYDPKKLWEDLRCGLVHSYAEGGTYVFTDANKAGFHFDTTSRGKIILNLEDFCADLREAYKNFRNDILTNNKTFLKAKKRYKSMGLMGLVPINNL